jgi:hypothetical protein
MADKPKRPKPPAAKRYPPRKPGKKDVQRGIAFLAPRAPS